MIQTTQPQESAIATPAESVEVDIVPIAVRWNWFNHMFFHRTYACGCIEPMTFRLVIRAYGETIETGYYIKKRCPKHFVQDIVYRHCRCFNCQRIIIPGSEVGMQEIPKRHPRKQRICLYAGGPRVSRGVLTCTRPGCSPNLPRGTWDGASLISAANPWIQLQTIMNIVS